MLAQAVSNAFLIDPAKPILALLTTGLAAAIVSRLTKDIAFCGLPSTKWHTMMVGGLTLGLLLVLFVPIFWIGWPLQIAASVGPLLMYWPERNNALPDKLRFVIGGDSVRAFFKSRRKATAFAGSRFSFKDFNKKDRPVPAKGDPLLPAHSALEALLTAAIDRNASRLDAIVKSDGITVVATVDGIRNKLDAPTSEAMLAAIGMLKDYCGLDVKEQRKRQTGTCTAVSADTAVILTVMVAGSTTAQQLRIDFDLATRLGKKLKDLGFTPQQLRLLEPITPGLEGGGVVLLAAAPGQGLTTLGLAATATHDAFTNAVKAFERNCLHRVEGIDHQSWNSAGGVDYHTQLQSIVRRNPDVIYVDDISEPGTGKVIAAPTSADVRFYVTVPCDGVGPAITEWFRSVGDVKLAAAPLRAVIACRLIRKLCLACRVGFPPTPDQAKRLGIPEGKAVELFRSGGKVQIKNKVEDCPMCKGTGFQGQLGVYEVLPLDDEAREHLAKGDLKSAYNAMRIKFKAPGMQEAALLRVREGVTSLEEVVRVFAPPKPAATAAQPAPATAKPASTSPSTPPPAKPKA